MGADGHDARARRSVAPCIFQRNIHPLANHPQHRPPSGRLKAVDHAFAVAIRAEEASEEDYGDGLTLSYLACRLASILGFQKRHLGIDFGQWNGDA